jgi:16S rRNA processing protein RimM
MRAGDRELVVAAARPFRDRGLVVAFEGITGREAAEALRGTVLRLDEVPELGEGEYWPEDLIGLHARLPDGSPLGEVAAVVRGPQDRLVIETASGSRVEVPFVSDLVSDPEDGGIVIDPPAGLFD